MRKLGTDTWQISDRIGIFGEKSLGKGAEYS